MKAGDLENRERERRIMLFIWIGAVLLMLWLWAGFGDGFVDLFSYPSTWVMALAPIVPLILWLRAKRSLAEKQD